MSRARPILASLGCLLAASALAQVQTQSPAQPPEGAQPPAVVEAVEAARPAAPAPEDIAALNPLAGLDKGSLSGFRDLPLFTPSRRRPEPPPVIAEAPPPPPPPPPARAPAPAPEIKLSGVIEGPEGAVAVVENEGETERLRLGDDVGGWLVTGIEGFTLKLTLDDREQEYRLFQRAEKGAAAGEDEPEGESSGDEPE